MITLSMITLSMITLSMIAFLLVWKFLVNESQKLFKKTLHKYENQMFILPSKF